MRAVMDKTGRASKFGMTKIFGIKRKFGMIGARWI